MYDDIYQMEQWKELTAVACRKEEMKGEGDFCFNCVYVEVS